MNKIIIESGGQAEEMKRVQKLIKKFKVNQESAEQRGILARSYNPSLDKASLRGAVPDEEDKKNIEELIRTYNIAFPYPHIESLQYVHEETQKMIRKIPRKLRRDNKKAISLGVRLPVPFDKALKAGYPLIISDKKQFEWFLENFPQFNLLKGKK
jgi:hypothetical protein